MKKLSMIFLSLMIAAGCGGNDDDDDVGETAEEIPAYVGSFSLQAMSLVCVDEETILTGTPPDATGTLSILESLEFAWSVTLTDDEGSLSECTDGLFDVFTFSDTGTVTERGAMLEFDGEEGAYQYDWEIDGAWLVLSDEFSAYVWE